MISEELGHMAKVFEWLYPLFVEVKTNQICPLLSYFIGVGIYLQVGSGILVKRAEGTLRAIGTLC